MKLNTVGTGKVVLIAGGGRCYTDIAARFVASGRSVEDLINEKYCPSIVKKILGSGHLAATEFDYFLFGVEGYSRITEVQLVRKRLASYMISSGRSHIGKREYSITVPKSTIGFTYKNSDGEEKQVEDWVREGELIYDSMVSAGIPEEDARYYKLQATTFKGIIGMNAHALRDWFRVRCCFRAQREIRDMATKMKNICMNVQPELFANCGATCHELGYCPENELQCDQKRGKVPTHADVLKMIKKGEW